MKAKQVFTIKYVSRQTGLKAYLIRSWEQRYNAICPRRSESNRRVFSDADIVRLNLLKQALDQGHTISHVARLSDGELRALAIQSLPIHSRHGPSSPDRTPPSVAETHVAHRRIVDAALSDIMQLEVPSLQARLEHAAVELPRHAFLQSILIPLFERVGELWRAGRLKAVNEHMLSVIVRSILWNMLQTVVTPTIAPIIVVATPVGHWHEFGALMAALAAAESGWRVNYFGPNLPADEIAYAVKKTNAGALALGLCHRLNGHQLTVELGHLRRLVGKALPIFVGGAGVAAMSNVFKGIEAVICNDLDQFRRRLDGLVGS